MAFGQQSLSLGTGFVCESAKGPVLVTNWHNLSGRNLRTKNPLSPTAAIPDTVRIWHNRAGHPGQWVVKSESLLDQGNPRWIEHPALGDNADIVALPLTDLDGAQLYPYNLNASPDLFVEPSDAVSVIGFPFGLPNMGSLAIWATGFIASEPEIDFDNEPVFLVDCRTRQGQSGSPVVAYRSAGSLVQMKDGSIVCITTPALRFLGIYCGRVNQQSDLGFVWKAKSVAQVVASI